MKELTAPDIVVGAKKVASSIAEKIRGYGSSMDVIYIAYLFYKLHSTDSKNVCPAYSDEDRARKQWDRFTRGEIALSPHILNSTNVENFIRAYKVFEHVYDDRIYASIVACSDKYIDDGYSKIANESSPGSIVELAQSILGMRGAEKIADICCGCGNFIINSALLSPDAQYYGYEMNINCAAVLAMRADVLGVRPRILTGDVWDTLAHESIKFDKIFSDYPFGQRIDNYEEIIRSLPFWIGRGASDWYFNDVIINHLAKNGKAVAIASAGSTWNLSGKDARKYFVENGYIEAVVNISSELLHYSTIPLTVYIFSHNNKHIKLINAEDYATARNKHNRILSKQDIKEIMDLLQSSSEKSILVTKDEVRAKDYSLAFKAYRSGLPEYENATKLSEVAEIRRGIVNSRNSTITANIGKYLLQISDLESGIIKNDLDQERSTEIEKGYYVQRLLPYDIIITRSAQPVKVAIVPPNEQRELYPNGNMFVVRLRTSAVNPYYLLAFLLSRDGQEALNHATTGSTLKTISAASLSELVFPLQGSHEQKEIANRIIESISQYRAYSLKAYRAKDRIENAYYEEEG